MSEAAAANRASLEQAAQLAAHEAAAARAAADVERAYAARLGRTVARMAEMLTDGKSAPLRGAHVRANGL